LDSEGSLFSWLVGVWLVTSDSTLGIVGAVSRLLLIALDVRVSESWHLGVTLSEFKRILIRWSFTIGSWENVKSTAC
jgi:hypothetical protein